METMSNPGQEAAGVTTHHITKPKGSRRRDERGAGLIEYALLLALIAIVVFGAVSFFGSSTGGGFNKSQSCFSAAYSGSAIPANCK